MGRINRHASLELTTVVGRDHSVCSAVDKHCESGMEYNQREQQMCHAHAAARGTAPNPMLRRHV